MGWFKYLFLVFISASCSGEDDKEKIRVIGDRQTINSSCGQGNSLGVDYLREKIKLEETVRDSMHQAEVIKDILVRVAYRIKTKKKDSFDIYSRDSSTVLQHVDYEFGHLFSKDQEHLIVTYNDDCDYISHLKVFLFDNDTFKLILFEEWGDMNFLGYYIRDINGDKQKDFVVKWWPTAGCCPRDMEDVFLYDAINNIFGSAFEFENPEFFPNKKQVRGMTYGHPGEAELYCFQWNGNKLDTIEFIFPNHLDTVSKTYIQSKKYRFKSDSSMWTIIEKIPTAYLEMKSTHWFDSY